MLEWLGDVGGLFEALSAIGYFIVAPVSAFAMKTKLLTLVFRLIVRQKASSPEIKQPNLPMMTESLASP